MKCGCKQTPTVGSEDTPQDYSLDPSPGEGPPATLDELSTWLARQSPSGNWFGKLYVATTICWDQARQGFRQRGCSPNYKAGWWTLACCKHDMRRSSKLKQALAKGDRSCFVFTLAEKSPIRGSVAQALVSVAKVTKHYATMKEYALNFILQSGSPALISSRLSRESRNDGLCGWRFGDCHANRQGVVGAPRQGHVHHGRGLWNEDVESGHEILVSDTFLVWERPSFASVAMIKQSRYGRDVTDLKQVLRPI